MDKINAQFAQLNLDLTKYKLNGETEDKNIEKTLTEKIIKDVAVVKEYSSTSLTKKITKLYDELYERTKGPSEEEIQAKENERMEALKFLENTTPSVEGGKKGSDEDAINMKFKTITMMI